MVIISSVLSSVTELTGTEGFTTLTQDGDVLAEATLSRFGKSNPLGIYDSILNTERLDPALVNDWFMYYELETNMDESIELNKEKWYLAYDENMSYDNVKFLYKFLSRRKVLLDKHWAI